MAKTEPGDDSASHVWPPAPVGHQSGTVQTETPLPPGCVIEVLPDGSLRVTEGDAVRARSARNAGIGAVMWNGLLLLALVVNYGTSPAAWRVTRIWHDWGVMGGLFALIGVGLAHGALFPRSGQSEWVARADGLERRSQWLGGRWARRYRGGELRLVRVPGRDGEREYWGLTFHCWRMRFGRGSVWDGRMVPCTSEQLRHLGEILSERTGWPLYLP